MSGLYVGSAYTNVHAIELVYVWLCTHPYIINTTSLWNSTTDVSCMQPELDPHAYALLDELGHFIKLAVD